MDNNSLPSPAQRRKARLIGYFVAAIIIGIVGECAPALFTLTQ